MDPCINTWKLAATISRPLAIGIIWIVSGICIRPCLCALREGGWGILFSGLLAVLAGGLIPAEWPSSGLWVLGFLLGIDLIVHGIA